MPDSLLEKLNDKTADVEKIAERAIEDNSLIAGLVEGLTAKNEDYRYNCSKTLHTIGKKQAGLLYPYWDAFVKLLDSKNSYHRMSAVNHLAYLAEADKENKFTGVFDKYYSLLDDQSVIVSIYVAQASGRIALAKPELAEKITRKLFDVDKTHHLPGRKELIKAGVIESFDKYFKEYHDKQSIFSFVKNQIESESPKTRNLAKAFIKKWDRR